MSIESLRPRNLNINYLPPLLILSSPPSLPSNVKQQSAQYRITNNHSGPKRTSSKPPLPLTVVMHWPDIIPDLSSPTTEAPAAMFNLDDIYSFSDKAYIEPAVLLIADHSANRCHKTLHKQTHNWRDVSELPAFDPLYSIVVPQKALNQILISFCVLNAIAPIHIFRLSWTNSIMGQLEANTTSYDKQQLLVPEKEWQCSWQPVTDLELYLWLPIQIYIGPIGVPPDRYWMQDGVYLPKNGLQPTAYLGKTHFRRSTPLSMCLHTIHQLTLLTAYLDGL